LFDVFPEYFREYLKLQITLTMRKIYEFSQPLNSYFFIFILISLFIFFSIFLFNKTDNALYPYIFISLCFTSQLNEKNRNDFIRIIFGKSNYLKVRMAENLIFAAPFILFMLFRLVILGIFYGNEIELTKYLRDFLAIVVLIVLSILLSFFNNKSSKTLNKPIPTPFYKKPFEFIIGFRNTFFLFILSYFLTIMAIKVGNFNLGVFSLLSIFLIVPSYYIYLESEYFVLLHSLTPKKFLIEKMNTAFLFTAYLFLPILISLIIFIINNSFSIDDINVFQFLKILLAFILVGYSILTMFILAKYSNFPHEIGLKEVMILFIGVIFPPAILVIIPYFYRRSTYRLGGYL